LESGRRREQRGRACLWLAAILIAFAVAAPPAQAAFPGQNGKIAFVVSGDIWTMNPDGSDRTQLTSGPATDDLPSWSPDGQKILFLREVPSPVSRNVFPSAPLVRSYSST
jgi:hypothetical protein